MFYELRRYKINAGRMDEWVEFMERTIIPFQVSKGMVIAGSFRGEDDTTYVWLRRFASEAERAPVRGRLPNRALEERHCAARGGTDAAGHRSHAHRADAAFGGELA